MTKQERIKAELAISLASKSVKPNQLNDYRCVAAIRGNGSCNTYADRYRPSVRSSTPQSVVNTL